MAAERIRQRMMANPSFFNPAFTETDPRFGAPAGIPVGTLFQDRKHCALKGVHTRSVAGISGTTKEGAFSVCLSGGYRDDKDDGDFFVYTGTGGQEDSFGGNGGPQVEDQTFEHRDNRTLLKSVETRRPVRVIRGPNVRSKYAPANGYRYDGLYVVEKAYMVKNKDGFAICQYELRRVPGQPPLPFNPSYKGQKA